jgi:hypothetical protein
VYAYPSHRIVAYRNAAAWEVNQHIVARLIRRFEVACACLVLAIAFWSLNLALD